MSQTSFKRREAVFLGRSLLPLVAAALLAGAIAGDASAAVEQDLQNGRLGYKWVPDPPKRPLTPQEEFGIQFAKYGGGGLIGIWLLRRLFSNE